MRHWSPISVDAKSCVHDFDETMKDDKVERVHSSKGP